MSQGRKGKLNYRCPACFIRELDIDMFYDAAKAEYYCLRCPFTGTEEDVKRLNQVARFRYKCINERIKTFD